MYPLSAPGCTRGHQNIGIVKVLQFPCDDVHLDSCVDIWCLEHWIKTQCESCLNLDNDPWSININMIPDCLNIWALNGPFLRTQFRIPAEFLAQIFVSWAEISSAGTRIQFVYKNWNTETRHTLQMPEYKHEHCWDSWHFVYCWRLSLKIFTQLFSTSETIWNILLIIVNPEV